MWRMETTRWNMSDMNETKDRVADAPGKRALLEA
ncbi:TetR family transcriptional regulator, partial [Pseudomonas aeruginosa]|nr:TetR family transcriptional regulator [Pseudomonas aeruginosa]